MGKEFSEEFKHDIADLLDICKENKTDNITISMDYGCITLEVDMTFRVKNPLVHQRNSYDK